MFISARLAISAKEQSPQAQGRWSLFSSRLLKLVGCDDPEHTSVAPTVVSRVYFPTPFGAPKDVLPQASQNDGSAPMYTVVLEYIAASVAYVSSLTRHTKLY